MKYILVFAFAAFVLTNASAQKKPAPKPATAAASSSTKKENAASGSGTSTAFQTVYMVNGTPEEFKKLSGMARTNFEANKLDDSRFAMQQMLAELDMIIGKEVLKMLPASLMNQTVLTKADNVSGASGFLGVIIHREYGREYTGQDTATNRNVVLEIISNSPVIASINTLLSLPLIGNTGDNKVIKVSGYKALLTKQEGANGTVNYEMQMPLGNSLITLKAPGASQEQLAQTAATLPISEMAKMLQ